MTTTRDRLDHYLDLREIDLEAAEKYRVAESHDKRFISLVEVRDSLLGGFDQFLTKHRAERVNSNI